MIKGMLTKINLINSILFPSLFILYCYHALFAYVKTLRYNAAIITPTYTIIIIYYVSPVKFFFSSILVIKVHL